MTCYKIHTLQELHLLQEAVLVITYIWEKNEGVILFAIKKIETWEITRMSEKQKCCPQKIDGVMHPRIKTF